MRTGCTHTYMPHTHRIVLSHTRKTAHICREHICIHAPRTHITYICIGWRRLIGSPELHIIFHKRATKYRSLLRKMTYKKNAYMSHTYALMHHVFMIYASDSLYETYMHFFYRSFYAKVTYI